MTERMNRLPPIVRSNIARQICVRARGSDVLVRTNTVIEMVRSLCPKSITDRELEEAIAEEAIAAGLAVHFNHPSGPAERDDAV